MLFIDWVASLFSGTGKACEKSWLVTTLNLLDLWNWFLGFQMHSAHLVLGLDGIEFEKAEKEIHW